MDIYGNFLDIGKDNSQRTYGLRFMILFDKIWFEKYSKNLCLIINNSKLLRNYLGIQANNIIKITPSNYIFKRGNNLVLHSKSKNVYAIRLARLRGLWYLLHYLDTIKNYNRQLIGLGKKQYAFDTTTDYYSDTGTGSTTVDGEEYYYLAGGSTWAMVRAASGTGASGSSTSLDGGFLSSTTSNYWSALYRSQMTYDVSDIGATDTIVSTSWFGTVRSLYTTIATSVNIVNAILGAVNNIQTTDFAGNVTYNTRYSSDLANSGLTVGNTYEFIGNATMISYIDSVKGSIATIGLKCSNDIDNSAPTWQSNARGQVAFHSVDGGTALQDPYLEIVYSPSGSATGQNFIMS